MRKRLTNNVFTIMEMNMIITHDDKHIVPDYTDLFLFIQGERTYTSDLMHSFNLIVVRHRSYTVTTIRCCKPW